MSDKKLLVPWWKLVFREWSFRFWALALALAIVPDLVGQVDGFLRAAGIDDQWRQTIVYGLGIVGTMAKFIPQPTLAELKQRYHGMNGAKPGPGPAPLDTDKDGGPHDGA